MLDHLYLKFSPIISCSEFYLTSSRNFFPSTRCALYCWFIMTKIVYYFSALTAPEKLDSSSVYIYIPSKKIYCSKTYINGEKRFLPRKKLQLKVRRFRSPILCIGAYHAQQLKTVHTYEINTNFFMKFAYKSRKEITFINEFVKR